MTVAACGNTVLVAPTTVSIFLIDYAQQMGMLRVVPVLRRHKANENQFGIGALKCE